VKQLAPPAQPGLRCVYFLFKSFMPVHNPMHAGEESARRVTAFAKDYEMRYVKNAVPPPPLAPLHSQVFVATMMTTTIRGDLS
jgi:hypothetical protein